MSRFIVKVFSDGNKTVDELMEPYGYDKKVKKIIIKTKEEIVSHGKRDIEIHIKNMKESLKYCKDQNEVKRRKKTIPYLRKLLKLDDEEFYKLAIKKYSKNLIDENGSLFDYNNPYGEWGSYDKNSQYTKLICIENPNKRGEYIYTNTIKVKDINWDIQDYREIITDATLFPDGSWHDEFFNSITKLEVKDGEVKYEYEDSDVEEPIVQDDWQMTIVEIFL